MLNYYLYEKFYFFDGIVVGEVGNLIWVLDSVLVIFLFYE